MASSAATPFFARLDARALALDSLLCVGLDPHEADLPEKTPEAAYTFCRRLIDATADIALAFKPNAAFFEVFGAAGVDVLSRVIADCGEVPVILDVKRGDISTTAQAYADAAYKHLGAGAVTVSAYMGADSVAPFTADASRGVFVLCKTSNPSSKDIQTIVSASGERVFETVAGLCAGAWNGAGNVGLVVGATDADALAAVRRRAPGLWILAPGVGFQGGDLGLALAAGLREADGLGIVLPVSRGISRAADPRAAALALRQSMRDARDAWVAGGKARPAPAVAAAPAAGLAAHKRAFLSSALASRVLRFGAFTLKSGRLSPYFFNAGNFQTGSALATLGRTYAAAISAPGVPAFDVLFGPAYKGIPLATAAAMALSEAAAGGLDVPVAYNRKEAKDHGEGGTMVGAPVAGRRVLIVDDVISAGTAIGESVALLKAAGAVPVGVVVGLDRQERGGGAGGALADLSAVQQVSKDYGIPVTAVATLADLLAFVEEEQARGGGDSLGALEGGLTLPALLAQIREYRAQYGVE